MRPDVLLSLCCFVGAVLAVDPGYEDRTFPAPKNPGVPGSGDQFIKYWIKVPNNFPPNGPVFYGTAGRVTVANLKKQYPLFDAVAFDNAIVVYVEQRYFGESNNGETNLPSIAALEQQRFKYVLNDHVELIKYLSYSYGTSNFLVFGGGHGGLIAGYLAQRFANEKTLSKYNVFAWSSSPPLKYLLQNSALQGTDLQQINTQVASLLRSHTECNDDAIIAKFKLFYEQLKGLRGAAGTAIANAIARVRPPVAIQQTAASPPSPEVREFVIFLRNTIRDAAYDNRAYNDDGTPTGGNNPLVQLCQAINAIDNTALTAAKVNAILTALIPGTGPIKWKVKNVDGSFDKDVAVSRWQDCTDLAIVSCPLKDDPKDPFTGTQWNTDRTCNSLHQFKLSLGDECTGMFGPDFYPGIYKLKDSEYPLMFERNTVVTLNKKSMFYGSFGLFANDGDTAKQSAVFDVSGVDNVEFDVPRVCDTDKIKDVRYLTLRAFACISKLTDTTTGCAAAARFNDDQNGAPYDDTPPTAPRCGVETTDAKDFPWGHDSVDFPNIATTPASTVPTVPTTTPKTVPSTDSTPLTSTPNTATPPTGATDSSTGASSGSGSSFAPLMSLLFGSLCVWLLM